MTTVDATAGDSGLPAAVTEEAPAAPAVVGPLAGDPSILGLGAFIAGSVALGLALVGVVPFGVGLSFHERPVVACSASSTVLSVGAVRLPGSTAGSAPGTVAACWPSNRATS